MKKLYTLLIFCMLSFISYSLNVPYFNDSGYACTQTKSQFVVNTVSLDLNLLPLFTHNAFENEIEGFKLYPNPVKDGKVNITSNKNLPKQIIIYDVLGKEVFKYKLTSQILNVSDLRKGVYILKAVEEDKATTRKLVIE